MVNKQSMVNETWMDGFKGGAIVTPLW